MNVFLCFIYFKQIMKTSKFLRENTFSEFFVAMLLSFTFLRYFLSKFNLLQYHSKIFKVLRVLNGKWHFKFFKHVFMRSFNSLKLVVKNKICIFCIYLFYISNQPKFSMFLHSIHYFRSYNSCLLYYFFIMGLFIRYWCNIVWFGIGIVNFSTIEFSNILKY